MSFKANRDRLRVRRERLERKGMQDFFGNNIDVEKVGEPARFEFPLLVKGLALAVNQGYAISLADVLDNITLLVKTEGASFQIGLNTLPLTEGLSANRGKDDKPANNLMDELIAPSPEPCVYGFISSIDDALITAPSLPEIREKAKNYIGQEDWEGKIVTQLQILKIQQAEIVK